MDYSIIIESNQAIAKRNYEGDFGLDPDSGITNNSWKVKLPQSVKLEVGDRISYYNSMIKTNGISDEGTELLGISNVNNNLTDNTARLELGYYVYNNWFNNCMLPLGQSTLSKDFLHQVGGAPESFNKRNYNYQDTFHTYNVVDDTDTNIARAWWSDYGSPSLETFNEWLNNGSSSLYKNADELTIYPSNANNTATNNLAFYRPDTQRLYIGKSDWLGPYNNGYDSYHNVSLSGNYSKKYDIITSNSDVSTNIGFNSPIVIGNKITESLNNPNLEGNNDFVNPQLFDYTDKLTPNASLSTLKNYFVSENVLQIEDETCKAIPTSYGKIIYDIQNGIDSFSISDTMVTRTGFNHPTIAQRSKYFWNSIGSGDYKRTIAISELYGDLNLSKNISTLNASNLTNSSFYSGSELPEKNYPSSTISTNSAYPSSAPRDLGEQFCIFDDLEGNSTSFDSTEIAKITNNIIFRSDTIADFNSIKKPTTSDKFLNLNENDVIMTNMIANDANFDKIKEVFGLLEKPSSDIEINYNNQSFKDSLYATLELGQLDDNYSQSIYQLDDSVGQVVNIGIPMPVALPCVKSIADNLESGDINAKSYIEYKKRARLPIYAGLFCNEDNISENKEFVSPFSEYTLLREFRNNHMYEIDFHSRYNSTRTPISNNLSLPSSSKFSFTDINGNYFDDTKIKENDLGIVVGYRNLVEQGDNVIEFGLGNQPAASQFSFYSVDTTNNYSVNSTDFVNISTDSDLTKFGDNSVQSLVTNNTIYLTQNSSSTYSETDNRVDISDTKAMVIEYEADNVIIPSQLEIFQQATFPSDSSSSVSILPLAGGGGRNIYSTYSGYFNSGNWVDFPASYYSLDSGLNNIFNNIINYTAYALSLSSYNLSTSNPVTIGYEFHTAQIVTNYKLFSRASSGDRRDEAPSSWEFRAAVDKATYDSGTYVTLDTISGLTTSNWHNHGTSADPEKYASNHMDVANSYDIPTSSQGNYKYYVLHITDNCGATDFLGIGEWCLFGQSASSTYSIPFAGAGGYYGIGSPKPFTSYADNTFLGRDYVNHAHDNVAYDSGWPEMYTSNNTNESYVSYEFNSAQIINRYAIWPVYSIDTNRNLRKWELRAAENKSAYDAGTFTTLQEIELVGDNYTSGTEGNYWNITNPTSSSDPYASNNINLANNYTFTNTTGYKYYVLVMQKNFGGNYFQFMEWALFGDVSEVQLIGSTQTPELTNKGYITSVPINGGSYDGDNVLFDNLIGLSPDGRDTMYYPSSAYTNDSEWNMKFEFTNSQVVTFMNIWNFDTSHWTINKFRLFGKNGAFTSTTDGTLIQTDSLNDYQEITSSSNWLSNPRVNTDKYANLNLSTSLEFKFSNSLGYTHYQITIDQGDWFSGSLDRFVLNQVSFGGYKFQSSSISRMPKKLIVQGQKLNANDWVTIETNQLDTEPLPAGGITRPINPALSTLTPPYNETFNASNTSYKKLRLVIPESFTDNSINIGELVVRKRNHITTIFGNNYSAPVADNTLVFYAAFTTPNTHGQFIEDTDTFINVDPSYSNINNLQDGNTSSVYRISMNTDNVFSTISNKVVLGTGTDKRYIVLKYQLTNIQSYNNFITWSTTIDSLRNRLMKDIVIQGLHNDGTGLKYDTLFDGVLSANIPPLATFASISSESPYNTSETLDFNKSNTKYAAIFIVIKSVYEQSIDVNDVAISDILFSGYDETNTFKEVPFIGFNCRNQISSVNKYKVPLPIEGEFFGIPRSLQNNSLSFINSWERKIKPSDNGIVVAKVEFLNVPELKDTSPVATGQLTMKFSGGDPDTTATGEIEYINHYKTDGTTHISDTLTDIKIINNGVKYKASPVIQYYFNNVHKPLTDSIWITPPQVKITMGSFGESYNDGVLPNIQSQYPYIMAGANDISTSFDSEQSRMSLNKFHTLMRQGQESNNLERYYDASMVYNSDVPLINPDGQSGNEVMKINNRKFYCNSTRAGFTEAKPQEIIEKQVLPIKNPYIRQKGIASGLSGVGLINLYAGKVDGTYQKINPYNIKTYGDTLFDKLGFEMKQLIPSFGKQNQIFSRGLHNKNISKNDKPLSAYNEMVMPFTTNGIISSTLNQSFNTNNLSYLVGSIDGNNDTAKSVPQTSEVLIAESLPDKYSYSHILIYSNIIPKHNYIAAQDINKTFCIGNITRSYQTGNIIYGNQSGIEYIVDKSYILSEIDVELKTELGLDAPVDAGSTVVFRINKRKPIPLSLQEKQ